jgi:hypothetical protein
LLLGSPGLQDGPFVEIGLAEDPAVREFLLQKLG